MQTQQTDVKPLSPRQREVLRASVNGATAKQVSEMLNISARTVDLHIQAAMAKLNCTTKAHAVLRASRLGLI
jgi:DNA-binding NarL/FixJ family response regulator